MVLGRIIGIFRRKKEEPIKPVIETPKVEMTSETVTIENLKAKMDLVLTQLDSLRTQYESINERMKQAERMLKEIYDMAKS